MAERPATLCMWCGARLARDHVDTMCSPCRRSGIERAAKRSAELARESTRIRAAFYAFGLYGVAEQLRCSPEDALDAALEARVIPIASPRRQELLRRLVALRDRSHVEAAQAIGISRWTVASYRSQLGIERPRRAERRSLHLAGSPGELAGAPT